MTGLCLGRADLAGFAAATGDLNPLHLDPEFARVSVFGQPIAHGVLAAAATLALSGTELTGITRLAIDFDLPVLPGLRYRVQSGAAGASLRLGDVSVLSVRWTADEPVPDPEPAGPPGHPPTGPPRVLSAGQLAGLPAESGRYQLDLPSLHRLLRRLTGTSIPPRLAEPLAWASYFAGMRTPGRDALLAGLRLAVAPAGPDATALAASAAYQARVSRFDPRTGLVTLSARLTGRSRADLTVSAFLRHRLEPPDLGDTGAVRSGTARLAGQTVLVIGASRGLGAALACGLAGQGARVLAMSSRPVAPDLARRVRAARLVIDWMCCDASDADGLGAALGTALCGRPLDGLVLAAGPRVTGLPLAADAVPACLAHVEEALRLALTPLAVAARSLREDAFVVFVSSGAVTGAQPLWPHYVMAKAALEGLAGHTARHQPRWRVVVARPPRLRTEMANGPASGPGALAPGAAAASILAHLLAATPAPGEVQLIDRPAFPAATTARVR